MFTEPLKNYNDIPRRRLDISVGVAYDTDLEEASRIAKECLENLEGRIKEEEIEIFFKEFGASSINFDARIWINYPAQNNYLRTQHQAIINIKKAFDRNGINIPFPIRTLDVNEKTISMLKNKFSN
jgi:small conductance mechanosensitive channel